MIFVPSLRARLTLSILVLTGFVAVLAVVVGMRILRSNVVDAAVEDQTVLAGDVRVITEAPLDDAGDVIGESMLVEESIPVEESFDEGSFEATLGETFELEPGEASVFEVQYLAELVDEFELLPALIEEFGTPDDEVLVELSTGATVSFPSGAAETPRESSSTPIVRAESIYASAGSIFDTNDRQLTDRQFEFASVSADDRTVGLVVDVTDELRALDEVRNALWSSAALVTVLAAAAAWFLVGRALRPVDAITAQVNQITAGNLADRVPEPTRRDEIGVLAATMNTMLGRLDLADRRRRQFISDASHELRTPVTVLRNEAEVARRAPGSTTVADLSSVVLAESERLGSMVEDLLSLARADEAKGSATRDHLIATDVDEVLLAETRRSRGIRVDRSRVSGGRVIAHPTEVARCIAHLLDNAARHAEACISVGVETADGSVVCWIDDDGPGLAANERERVFERFVRLDDARTRDRGGAGLGLAVVKELVDSMGGEIDVGDAPIGGARFRIRWPAA